VHPTRTLHGSTKGLRRAELLAAISLAIDLGLGQPMEHMLRSSLIATRIAERMGLDAQQRATVYYANLVGWIGCHADSPRAFRRSSVTTSPTGPTRTRWTMAGLSFLRLMVSHVGRELPRWERGNPLGCLCAHSTESGCQADPFALQFCWSSCRSDGSGPAGRGGAGVYLRALGWPGDAGRH